MGLWLPGDIALRLPYAAVLLGAYRVRKVPLFAALCRVVQGPFPSPLPADRYFGMGLCKLPGDIALRLPYAAVLLALITRIGCGKSPCLPLCAGWFRV